jgi:lipopolysaccharide transport system permease protein
LSNNTNNEWDLIIEPQQSLFNLHLKDVWYYRDLLGLLVKRDFISFYKQTILGPLWFFLQPAITTIVFTFIFGNLAGIKTPGGMPQPLFYMTGIICWNYFSECITKTSSVFKDNANILGKVYFPRLIMPLSIVVSNLVKFGVQALLLVITFIYYTIFQNYVPATNIHILLVPVLIIFMAALGLGLGMIISAMTTKYRDLAFFVTFGVQLLMYATTVIYPLSVAQKDFPTLVANIITYNPMTPVIECVRFGVFGGGMFSWKMFAYTTFVTIAVLLTGIIIFNKVEKDFIDTV